MVSHAAITYIQVLVHNTTDNQQAVLYDGSGQKQQQQLQQQPRIDWLIDWIINNVFFVAVQAKTNIN